MCMQHQINKAKVSTQIWVGLTVAVQSFCLFVFYSRILLLCIYFVQLLGQRSACGNADHVQIG